MNESCCKRAATLDYSSDARPAQPSKRPRPAAAFDKRDRGAAWVGDMKGAPNGQHTTANSETDELAAGEIRLIPHSPGASPRCHTKSQATVRYLALSNPNSTRRNLPYLADLARSLNSIRIYFELPLTESVGFLNSLNIGVRKFLWWFTFQRQIILSKIQPQ